VLLLAQLLIGLLERMNIGARSVPLDDRPLFIPQRDFMVKHPTVFTVSAPNAGFMKAAGQ
jgi:hypothetical protein